MVLKFQYHANTKYKNPLKSSEKIACVGQKLMYPIMGKIYYLTMLVFFKCHSVFSFSH